MMLNPFKSIRNKHKQSFDISERDQSHKAKYLGNVLISFMRGEGCVDKPLEILWRNFLNNENTAFPMEITICASGLKVETSFQGLTEYKWHRLLFCTHHSSYPRLFVWVYKHEGRKMKVEQRCHAILCKSEEKAALINKQLQEKRTMAFTEYTREKMRSQNSRLAIEKSRTTTHQSIPKPSSKTVRTKFLTLGSNFKPPSELSTGAPKLDSITEDDERCYEDTEVLYSDSVCLNPEINMPDKNDELDTQVENSIIYATQQNQEMDRFSNESGFLEENEEQLFQKV